MSGCGTRIVLRGKSPSHSATAALLRFAVSATGGAHLCSIQYYLRFWLSICRTSLAVSALRIMRYCPQRKRYVKTEEFDEDKPNGYGRFKVFLLRRKLKKH